MNVEPAAPAPRLRSLAEVAESLPAAVGGIQVSADGGVDVSEPAADLVLRFAADGLVYTLQLVPGDRGRRVILSADLGFVPYTVQAPEKRRAMLLILRATLSLPTVRFHLDHGQRVYLTAEAVIEGRATVPRLFLVVTRLLAEARPFARLLAQHL